MKHTEKISFHMHLNTRHRNFHTIILALSQTRQNLTNWKYEQITTVCRIFKNKKKKKH